MKRALIATLFNEADNVVRWWECLQVQTVLPDEIVIVDGGSQDGTWEKLQSLAAQSRVSVRLDQRRCNIAAGRNRAIQLTDADIIAATDAGSFMAPDWFGEIAQPLVQQPEIDVVAGLSVSVFENEFQKFLEPFEGQPVVPVRLDKFDPSSRNIAFRRQAWADAGGYPEWLTLTGEDALFNFELHKIGKRFFYNPKAVVRWPVRRTAADYFNMLRNYGYGAAEAQIYAPYFRRRLLLTVCPPLLLLSRHRFKHLGFRYRKNAASATGWIAGFLKGKRPPKDWRRVRGVWLSPQAQAYLKNLNSEIK